MASAIHQPPELLVSHVIGAATGGVDLAHFIRGLPVDRSELLALRLVACDDEDPVLRVASGRSSYCGVESLLDQIIGTGSGLSRRSARALLSVPNVISKVHAPWAIFGLDGRLGGNSSGRLTAPGRTEDPPPGLVGVACPVFVTIGQLPSPCLGWFDRLEFVGASTMAGWLLEHAPRALREYPDAGARGPG